MLSNRAQRTEETDMRETRTQFWVVVPCIWSETRINYQLDAIEYLFTLARHISGLHAHLQEQWML